MPKRVAVITDASSAEFWFPKWHGYYGGQFGTENLYVVTYQGLREKFRDMDLGGLWEVPHKYSDLLRPKVIASLVTTLLATHDVVVRCDTDEFLVADPQKYADLRSYIEHLTLPYVTARGIDLVETLDDAPIDYARQVLHEQRSFGTRLSPLNKTCITTVPLVWTDGFHFANVVPVMDDVFLFHMKFADIKRRVTWFEYMHNAVEPGGSESTYFATDLAWMEQHQRWLLNLERADGWAGLTGDGFDEKFLAGIARNEINGIYAGEFIHGGTLFEIPQEFARRV